MSKRTIALCLLTTATLAAGGASAQGSFPSKPIRFINPVAAGGNQDIVARAVGDQLAKIVGQQIIVESRPGASAIVGTRYVKSATPDGYTLLTISNTFARVPAIVAAAGYDPLKDFAAISMTADIPMVLSVTPSLPVKNTKELIALAKQRPGELLYASSGSGSTGHVAAEMFSRQAGIKLLHVPYKGNAPAVIDLVGGQVMIMFDQVSSSFTYIRAGKLRALGVTSKARVPSLPDVPPLIDSGVPGFVVEQWYGVWAPGGTPAAIVARLHREFSAVTRDPEQSARLTATGSEAVGNSSEEFAAHVRAESARWAKVVKEVGIRIQ